jgi:hypothetical protein
MLSRLRRAAVQRLGAPLLRAVAGTWRTEVVAGERWREVVETGRPFVLLCWHEALLPVIWHHRYRKISALISEAQDGVPGWVCWSIGYDRSVAAAREGKCSDATSFAGCPVGLTLTAPVRGAFRPVVAPG